MKIIIPHDIKGKDIWTVNGKITVNENLTLEQAKELKGYFPNIIIVEDIIPIKKKFTKE